MNEINELYTILKEKYKNKFRKLILFGSYARNEEHENSDIDIMIILKRCNKKKTNAICFMCYKINKKYGSLLTPFIINKKNFYENLNLIERGFKIWKCQ